MPKNRHFGREVSSPLSAFRDQFPAAEHREPWCAQFSSVFAGNGIVNGDGAVEPEGVFISSRTVLIALAWCATWALAPANDHRAFEAQVAEIVARIKPPEFPARDFPITDFGASTDGDCTVPIARAIAACHAAGGGRVVIPAGVWQTGAIQLKSNVNLHVLENATLSFSSDPAK